MNPPCTSPVGRSRTPWSSRPTQSRRPTRSVQVGAVRPRLGWLGQNTVSDSAYVGFYNWIGARGWTRNGTRLISDYNHQAMLLYSKDNGYISARNTYTVLDVRFVG